MLDLFNTLTRKKEPVGKKELGIYFCGPTVYDFAHLGNFRAYVFADLLRRYLEYLGHKVTMIMNITDVDDKTIRNSQKEKLPLKEFTEKYEKAFFEDVEALRIKKADIYPRATGHIKEMIELINILLKKGYAYKGDDGSVYYDISKFKEYGRLSKLNAKGLKAGARVSHDEYTKDEAQDFALWKAWSKEDSDVFWNAEIGGNVIKGRPGWHIECSAMSAKHLKAIDIHGGGVDLIFPHHENEIAQSEAATGKRFVDIWAHCEHLLVDGRKMSKSLGNFHTLRGLVENGYEPLAIRFLLISSHYKSQLNFTLKELDSAKKTVDNFNDFVRKLSDAIKTTKAKKENEELMVLSGEAKDRFEEYMNDDLNVPQALAVLYDMMRIVNREIDSKKADKSSLEKIYSFVMGINQIFDIIYEEAELTEKEKEMINERERLRKGKKFEEADVVREKLRKHGIILEDTPDGVRWKKAR